MLKAWMGWGRADCGMWNGNVLGFGWQEKELRSISRRCCSLSSQTRHVPNFHGFCLPFFPQNPPKMHQGIWNIKGIIKGRRSSWNSRISEAKLPDAREERAWWILVEENPKSTEVLCWFFMGMRHLEKGSGVWSRQGWETDTGLEVTVVTCGSWPVGTAIPWGKESLGSWKHLDHVLILKIKNPQHLLSFCFFFSGKKNMGAACGDTDSTSTSRRRKLPFIVRKAGKHLEKATISKG